MLTLHEPPWLIHPKEYRLCMFYLVPWVSNGVGILEFAHELRYFLQCNHPGKRGKYGVQEDDSEIDMQVHMQ
jgi:hypothetical protein